jgi:NAD(P)-dependent dehydrogenase (short-subunit alcohol dehydrogenase family)
MALACDVVQSAGLEECVAETHRRFGRLDVAITAVGWHPFSRFLDMPDQDVDYMINAELRSVIRLTRAVLPIMADQKGGRLIVVGSVPERWAIATLRYRRRAAAA